jgi:hypothetical protein
LSKNGFHRRIVAKTLTISLNNNNKKKQKKNNYVRWCRNIIHWAIQELWNKMIFSNEMQVVLEKDVRDLLQIGTGTLKIKTYQQVA